MDAHSDSKVTVSPADDLLDEFPELLRLPVADRQRVVDMAQRLKMPERCVLRGAFVAGLAHAGSSLNLWIAYVVASVVNSGRWEFFREKFFETDPTELFVRAHQAHFMCRVVQLPLTNEDLATELETLAVEQRRCRRKLIDTGEFQPERSTWAGALLGGLYPDLPLPSVRVDRSMRERILGIRLNCLDEWPHAIRVRARRSPSEMTLEHIHREFSSHEILNLNLWDRERARLALGIPHDPSVMRCGDGVYSIRTLAEHISSEREPGSDCVRAREAIAAVCRVEWDDAADSELGVAGPTPILERLARILDGGNRCWPNYFWLFGREVQPYLDIALDAYFDAWTGIGGEIMMDRVGHDSVHTHSASESPAVATEPHLSLAQRTWKDQSTLQNAINNATLSDEPKRKTIRDFARLTGLTKSTVGRHIKNDSRCAKAMRTYEIRWNIERDGAEQSNSFIDRNNRRDKRAEGL